MIFINASNTFYARAKTGIQRVVRNYIKYLHKNEDICVIVFYKTQFFKLSSNEEINHFLNADEFTPTNILDFSVIKPGDTLLDIDATWQDNYNVKKFFERFRSRGARIVRFHYDAVPMQFPQYSHDDTVYRYREFFQICMKYVDYWITNSQVVFDDLIEIFSSFNMGKPIGNVLPLGTFNNIDVVDECQISPTIKSLPRNGYFLSVGTIEPRKNIDTLLESYKKYIKPKKTVAKKLVIVGKAGWNTEKLINKIKQAQVTGWRKLLNKLSGKLIWLDNVNDQELAYLYANTIACFQMSHYEGYGLPVAEALAYGKPVVCTKGTSMEEIAPNNVIAIQPTVEAISEKMHDLSGKPDNSLTSVNYKPVFWEEAVNCGYEYLKSLEHEASINNEVYQAVYISIRPEKCIQSINTFLTNAKFVNNYVILTSKKFYNDFIEGVKNLNTEINIICEEDLLIGDLPEDHLERNTLLRRLLYKHSVISDNFIAVDDDYLVAKKIDRSFFTTNMCHFGYYFYKDGENWLGAYPKPTSFDQGIFRTIRYLKELGVETLLYNSHQPQIINKKIVNEILERTNGLNLDEWSCYFNLAKFLYPNQFKSKVFCVAGWPENLRSWVPDVVCQQVSFINRPVNYTNEEFDFENYINNYFKQQKLCNAFFNKYGNPCIPIVLDRENFGAGDIKEKVIPYGWRFDLQIITENAHHPIVLEVEYCKIVKTFDLSKLQSRFVHLPPNNDKSINDTKLIIKNAYNKKEQKVNIAFKEMDFLL